MRYVVIGGNQSFSASQDPKRIIQTEWLPFQMYAAVAGNGFPMKNYDQDFSR